MAPVESEVISIGKAAQMLGVGVRAVRAMVHRGLLTPVYSKGKCQTFALRDVALLAEAKLDKTDLSSTAVMALQAMVIAKDNQRRLDELTQLLGLSRTVLDTSEEGVASLHIRAEDDLEQDYTDKEQVFFWARVLLAFTEEYLDLVARFTAAEDPWKVYLDLGHHLSTTVDKSGLPYDKALESTLGYLDAARRHIRHLAYLYVRHQHGVREADRAFGGPQSYKDGIVSLLFPH